MRRAQVKGAVGMGEKLSVPEIVKRVHNLRMDDLKLVEAATMLGSIEPEPDGLAVLPLRPGSPVGYCSVSVVPYAEHEGSKLTHSYSALAVGRLVALPRPKCPYSALGRVSASTRQIRSRLRVLAPQQLVKDMSKLEEKMHSCLNDLLARTA